MLNDFAKKLIERFPLGYVATVTKGGMPSLSPKGTFFVLDDETIARLARPLRRRLGCLAEVALRLVFGERLLAAGAGHRLRRFALRATGGLLRGRS